MNSCGSSNGVTVDVVDGSGAEAAKGGLTNASSGAFAGERVGCVDNVEDCITAGSDT